MNITIEELAVQLNGILEGDPKGKITHPAKIEKATKGAVAFLANMKYEEFLYTTKASAVIIPKSLDLKQEVSPSLIRVNDAYSSFVDVLNKFSKSLYDETGIHDLAFVHPEATIGKNVYIGPFTHIAAGAKIGDNTRIEANATIGKYTSIGKDSHIHSQVTIYHYCIIGDRALIHSGAVIGSDGFGFAPNEKGEYVKVPQVGNVDIGNDVEIGANSTIDRATMGSTIVGNGVKIDNLVQIAHNVEINDHTVIAAQAGISGSTRIGKHVVVGGQAGFVGHINVADYTKINAQSGVSKSVNKEGTSISGSPAFDWREELKSKSLFRKLPELEQRIRDLEQQLKEK